jgi:hypothetical protein
MEAGEEQMQSIRPRTMRDHRMRPRGTQNTLKNWDDALMLDSGTLQWVWQAVK